MRRSQNQVKQTNQKKTCSKQLNVGEFEKKKLEKNNQEENSNYKILVGNIKKLKKFHFF